MRNALNKLNLGLLVLILLSTSALANNLSIASETAWTPTVGDDVTFFVYEAEQNADGVYTGTLEKKIIKIDGDQVTIQSTLTTRSYATGTVATSSKQYVVGTYNLNSSAVMVRDCAQPTTIPVSIQTDAGTFATCLMNPGPGKDLDGDAAVYNTFLGNVPFGIVRQDSVKVSNGNHIRLTLTQVTLGKAS